MAQKSFSHDCERHLKEEYFLFKQKNAQHVFKTHKLIQTHQYSKTEKKIDKLLSPNNFMAYCMQVYDLKSFVKQIKSM